MPLRRIFIDKANGSKRPLGIPTMHDRAVQALVKLALEPQWEAVFEPNSYGFRPGRSTHDAKEAIFKALCPKQRWILDADIQKCFDRINHAALLDKLDTTPAIRRQVRAWLKAGVMLGPRLFSTSRGTPQGGVISPLLANVALHGLEAAAASEFPKCRYCRVIRYADDFVVIGDTQQVIEQARSNIAAWLTPMGLELSPEKTRIVHSLQGFDFLSIHARQYKVGKHHSGVHHDWHSGHKTLLGTKTLTQPSKDGINRHKRAIEQLLRKPLTRKRAQQINQNIQGWSRYHSTESASRTFAGLDHWLWYRIQAKLRRQNQRIGGKAFRRRFQRGYKHEINGVSIAKHSAQKIVRHTKVQGARSPFDGDWSYWTKRGMNFPTLSIWKQTLLRWQKGKCARCGLYLRSDDQIELDRLIPGRLGGKYELTNLQLLHRWCHDAKTAEEAARLASDNGDRQRGAGCSETGTSGSEGEG